MNGQSFFSGSIWWVFVAVIVIGAVWESNAFAGGLLLLAALGILAMGIVLMIGHDDALERAPAAAE